MNQLDISELELIAAIRKVLSGTGPEVRVGVGDDAAVVAPGSGELVLTTDELVEDSHFLRRVTAARDLGYKAVIVALSDIAAMAASPRYALCALTLSERVDAAWAMELFGGIREACDEHALWLVGGDLTRGSEISVAVTAVGEVVPGSAITRSGATPGDAIVVTGSLGGAAAGRRLVEGMPRGLSTAERDAVGRFVRPAARIGEAALLASGSLTAMIDLSDGLAIDLARVCEASGVGAEITLASLPIHEAATREDALGGGEDYELLATVGPESSEATIAAVRDTFGIEVTRIGVITERPGLTGIGEDGSARSLPATGWDPFV